jgi:hypothetical protein
MDGTRLTRALGVALLAAIGMMAVGSSAAQAEIVVEGQPPGHRTLVGITFGMSSIRTPAGVRILCGDGSTFNALVLTNNIVHTTHLFYECSSVAPSPNCPVYENLNDAMNRVNAGFFVEKSLSIFAESEGKHYLVSEESKEPVATLYFDEECALPSELKLTGTTALRAPDILEKRVTHIFEPISEEEEKALKVGLLLGKEKATIEEGKDEVTLTGELKGLTWWLK